MMVVISVYDLILRQWFWFVFDSWSVAYTAILSSPYQLIRINLRHRFRKQRYSCTNEQPLLADPLKSLQRVAESLRQHFVDKLSWMTSDSLARAGLSSGAGGLDLVFVFDSSASVGETNFKKGIAFAKTIIDEFGVSKSKTGTRVAVVRFSSTAEVIFNLKTNAMPNKQQGIQTLGKFSVS